MAVIDGRVAAVGESDEILAEYPDLPRISARGQTVIPGLIDAHAHLMGLGYEKQEVDLRGTSSVEEALERMVAYAEKLDDGQWLEGRGWNQELWPDRTFPTRQQLDMHFPERPVYVRRVDGHAGWANSAAIRAAGEDSIRALSDPPGGVIMRGADGEPTGIFVDNAEDLIGNVIPDPTDEEILEAMRLAVTETARVGLTGVHDAGATKDVISLYQQAIDEGWFNLRLYAMVSGRGETFDHYCNNHLVDYGDQLTVQSVKFYIDGALGSRGAAMIDAYSDDPGNHGVLVSDPETFNTNVVDALACGYQINSHAIGDMGNRIVLDGYEAGGITKDGRHRNEHSQVIALDDIPRFAELGVVASMQPTHATSDKNMAEDRVGPHRIKGAYAWRTLLDQGTPIAFGSDFPVEKPEPLDGFFAAVTRQDQALQPEGGWFPNESVTRQEALYAFTMGAAYSGFQEDVTGSLSVGKFADFVVLSKDIMTIPSPEILETEIVATWLGGERIFGDM